MTPEECLRRMAGQDEAALAALYDALGGLLFAVAHRVTGSDAEAEEVVQDVFLTAWRQAATFQPERSSATTWMTTLARNKAIDRLRARRRRLPLFEGGDHPPEATDPAPTPAQATAVGERHVRINDGLTDLPATQREAVELAYLQGLTHPEIAAHLGETIGTVKSRIRLGLDRLRKKFRKGDSE